MRKKPLLLLTAILCVAFYSHAQEWNVYNGSVLPDANDPAFTENSQYSADTLWTIADDPEIAENKTLMMKSAGDGTVNWQIDYETPPTAITVIARVRAVDTTVYDKVVEFDTRFAPSRQKFVLAKDGEIELQRGGAQKITPEGHDVTKWHIYRYTFDVATGESAVYIDEELVPVLTHTEVNESTDSYFRFGDGSGGNTYGADVDWVVWDISGAYSPSQQPLDLYDGLTGLEERWALYDASVTPDAADPAYTENQGDLPPTWTVEDDPDSTGNKLLQMVSSEGEGGIGAWGIDFENTPSKITVVARVKALDTETYDNVIEFDTRFTPLRQKLVISGGNEVELQRDNSADITPEGLDVSEWNIFRYTFDAETGDAAVYLNENNIPILTTLTTNETDASYFRFGDGSNGNTYGALIDWVVWDTTGTYSPSQYPVYKDQPGADIEPPKNIIFVADESNLSPITDEPRDQPFIDKLISEGYNVTVRYDDNVSYLTETEMSVYNNADLVILGRSGPSGDFSGNNKLGWNRIKSPVMLMSPFAARSSRLNWFNSTSTPGIDGVPLDSIIMGEILMPDQPVFDDITIPGDNMIEWFKGPYRIMVTVDSVIDQSNGTMLAQLGTDDAEMRSVLFARFNTGVEFFTNAGDSAAAPRTYFGLGHDDTTFYNLLPDAEAIWLAEVERMANMSVNPLDFPSPNSGLSEIRVDGLSLEGFMTGVTDYVMSVSELPAEITATAINGEAQVTITPAEEVGGDATIEVIAPDGVAMTTYTITFESESATGPRILFVGDETEGFDGAHDDAIIAKMEEWGYRVTYYADDDYGAEATTPDHSEFRLVYFSESMSSQQTGPYADAGFPIPAVVSEFNSVGVWGIGDNGNPTDGSNDAYVTNMEIVNEQHPLTEDVYPVGTDVQLFDLSEGDVLQGYVSLSAGVPTPLGEISGYDGQNSWVAVEPSGSIASRMVFYGVFNGTALTATEDYWTILERSILWSLDSLGTGQKTSIEDLVQNQFIAYPNPSNGKSNLSFTLDNSSDVRVSVFNSVGRLVDVIIDDEYKKGEHVVEFDTNRYANGIYILRLYAEGREDSFKVLIEN